MRALFAVLAVALLAACASPLEPAPASPDATTPQRGIVGSGQG
jgi:uncharacterized lipoprotein YajG